MKNSNIRVCFGLNCVVEYPDDNEVAEIRAFFTGHGVPRWYGVASEKGLKLTNQLQPPTPLQNQDIRPVRALRFIGLRFSHALFKTQYQFLKLPVLRL